MAGTPGASVWMGRPLGPCKCMHAGGQASMRWPWAYMPWQGAVRLAVGPCIDRQQVPGPNGDGHGRVQWVVYWWARRRCKVAVQAGRGWDGHGLMYW